jgi:hypothetical protein
MDLAKRDEILPSVRQADDWDLVIVDEAHRMSARDGERRRAELERTANMKQPTQDLKPRTKELTLRTIRIYSRLRQNLRRNEKRQKNKRRRVDIFHRFDYFLFSTAALELYLLPARHAERPGRGYFFLDTEVIHAK